MRSVATAILEDCLVLQKAGREDLRVLPACSGLRLLRKGSLPMDDDYIWDHCEHGEPNDSDCPHCMDEYTDHERE